VNFLFCNPQNSQSFHRLTPADLNDVVRAKVLARTQPTIGQENYANVGLLLPLERYNTTTAEGLVVLVSSKYES
jgi:hypothetical protein